MTTKQFIITILTFVASALTATAQNFYLQLQFNDGDPINFQVNSGLKWSLDATTLSVTSSENTEVRTFDIPGVRSLSYLTEPAGLDGVTDSDRMVSLSVSGNSTWSMPKKPMRLKFAKKNVAGRPEKG